MAIAKDMHSEAKECLTYDIKSNIAFRCTKTSIIEVNLIDIIAPSITPMNPRKILANVIVIVMILLLLLDKELAWQSSRKKIYPIKIHIDVINGYKRSNHLRILKHYPLLSIIKFPLLRLYKIAI